jgi:HEAT repeat protein
VQLLSDSKTGVRKAAAEALGKMGDTRFLTALEPLFDDDEIEVRQAARDAARKLA